MTLRREGSLVTALLVVVAAVLLVPHIDAGGAYTDDWLFGSAIRFPEADGSNSAVDAMLSRSGSRVGGAAWWLFAHGVFGQDYSWHLALGATFAVAMSIAWWLLLRTVGVASLPAICAALFVLCSPYADSIRLWSTPAAAQLATAVFLFGIVLALRAFQASREGPSAQLPSLACSAFGCAFGELVLPLFVLAWACYLWIAPVARVRARIAMDVGLALVTGLGTIVLPSIASDPTSSSQWPSRAGDLADQSLTVLADSIAPGLDLPRGVVLLVAAVVIGAALRTRRTTTPRSARDPLLGLAGVGVVVLVAGYGLYVPSAESFVPLAQGLNGRLNLIPVLGFASLAAAAVWSVVALVGRGPGGTAVGVLAAAAISAGMAVQFIGDRDVWIRAAEEQQRIVDRVIAALPEPPPGRIVVVGAPTLIGPPSADIGTDGLTAFYSTDLDAALKLAYDDANVGGWPLNELVELVCGARALTVEPPLSPELGPDLYGRVTFVDVRDGRVEPVRSRTDCVRVRRALRPGAYAAAGLTWGRG